jgi:hypothetical protein
VQEIYRESIGRLPFPRLPKIRAYGTFTPSTLYFIPIALSSAAEVIDFTLGFLSRRTRPSARPPARPPPRWHDPCSSASRPMAVHFSAITSSCTALRQTPPREAASEPAAPQLAERLIVAVPLVAEAVAHSRKAHSQAPPKIGPTRLGKANASRAVNAPCISVV